MTIEAKITVADPGEMRQLGRRIGELLRAADLVLLTGELGAGKTTLTRGIGDGLGVRGPVTSPTFVLARTHPSTVGGPKLVHIDAYRLETSAELEDLDIDFANSAVVAEWGDGLLETGDSYLRLVITRPTGADEVIAAGEGSSAGGSGKAPGVPGDAASQHAGAADEDTDEELIEPRTVEITAAGPRWTAAALQQIVGDSGETATAGGQNQTCGAEHNHTTFENSEVPDER